MTSDTQEPNETGAEVPTGADATDAPGRLPSVTAVRPSPEPEELAAIIAAVEMAWPRPVVANPHQEIPRWRFSGRWWSKPLPVRRDRP